MIEWAFEKHASTQNDLSSRVPLHDGNWNAEEYKSPVSHYKPRPLSPLFDQQCRHSLQQCVNCRKQKNGSISQVDKEQTNSTSYPDDDFEIILKTVKPRCSRVEGGWYSEEANSQRSAPKKVAKDNSVNYIPEEFIRHCSSAEEEQKKGKDK
ncbi:hypothetical protein J6590_083304 [Homalodisca vitripennis]|nr:hypothetical protein J6590_083304 [Homalodisca vitripennis]